MGAYYFLACLLPPLPAALGEKMPRAFAELSGLARRHIHEGDAPVLQALLGVIDAINGEHRELGRDVFVPGGLVSREDLEAGRDLPEFLREFLDAKERGIHRASPVDRLWDAYYAYALEVARKARSRFLGQYLSWEVALRNQLVVQRAKERNLPAEDFLVLPHVETHDFGNLIAQLKSRKNPLAAEQYLDEERLKHIYRCEGTSPFSLDAILAYLSRAAIYGRWERIGQPFDVDDYLHQGGSTWTVQHKVVS